MNYKSMDENNIYNGLILFPKKNPALEYGNSARTMGRKARSRFSRLGWPTMTKKRKFKGVKAQFRTAKARARTKNNSATKRSKTMMQSTMNLEQGNSFHHRSLEIKRDMEFRGRPLSSHVIVLSKRAVV